jgi:electron transfer flavoprotein alpha subunit
MEGNVWVLAETWEERISDTAFELLALARELADELGVAVEALLLSSDAARLGTSLNAADRVLCVEHERFDAPDAEMRARTIASLMRQHRPQVLLVPLTNVSADEAGILPGLLQAPFVNSCSNVTVEGRQMHASCLLYGGKMQATVPLDAPLTILGVLPGCRPAAAGHDGDQPAIERVDAHDVEPSTVRFKGYLKPEEGDLDITRYDVLVAVGRGIQNEMNVELAEELAAALGGAVCGSRPVIDQGWLPLSRQVGKSGVTVKPKLYIAAGISGAPEHVEGMKDADLIVAINTDPDAPIFNAAHYGVVEDALDVLEGMTEAMLAKKG